MTRKPPAEPPHGRTTITQPGRRSFLAVNDKNGQPVQSADPLAYLAWHTSTGRYYVSPSEPRVYLGRDLDIAIWRFREWSQSNVPHPPFEMPTGEFVDGGELLGRIPLLETMSEPALDMRYRELILDDPKLAAERLGIPELARLSSLSKPEPSLKLADLFETYATHAPGKNGDGLSKRWVGLSRPYWGEFCRVVEVKTVADVTVDHVITYGDHVKATATSPTYARHRYGLVKSVMSFAVTRGKDQEQLQRVLTACKILKMPKSNGTDPKPISRNHFTKLLKAADVKFKAIYLLSLNAALYPSEVAAVKKTHANLSKRSLVMERGKTGCPRVAVLWPETVKAIRAYQKSQPHSSEFLFVSNAGDGFAAQTISNNHRALRDKAKVPTVEFAHIRDGSETAAIEGGADVTHAKLLAGHRISGMTDAYVKRNPKMVADACEAIRAHYLG